MANQTLERGSSGELRQVLKLRGKTKFKVKTKLKCRNPPFYSIVWSVLLVKIILVEIFEAITKCQVTSYIHSKLRDAQQGLLLLQVFSD